MLSRTPLYQLQAEAGAQFEVWCGWEIASVISDPVAEYQALRRDAAVLDIGYAGKLRFFGKDRVRYLHNMLSNDIRSLQPGQGCYATLLTRQGFMEADLRVYALDEELWLECPPCGTSQVVETLRKHIVSERVEVADATTAYGILSLQGPRAAPALENLLHAPPPSLGPLESRIVAHRAGLWLLINRDRTGSGGYDLWIPAGDLPLAWEELTRSATAVGWRALNWARTEAGIPWYGLDMNDRTLPMEMGLAAAISLNKGCYRGQEIVARIIYRGKLDRGLAGIAVEGDPPPPGADIIVAEQKAGAVTSATFSPALGKTLALAVVRNSFAEPGTAVEIRWQGAVRRGVVTRLPVDFALDACCPIPISTPK